MDPLFGRGNELERLLAALERAERGAGSLVLVTGEAGIGKSRLVKEVESRARERGSVAIAWGRCWEAGGAPAFWPWTQVFRALGREPFGQPEHAPDSSQRFVLFDAATRALADAAREAPRLVLLDDLHVADVSSLLLLLFAARELGGMPVLVVGTVREPHPFFDEEVGALLAKIRRESEVLPLPRLTSAEVTAWAVSRSAEEAERLHRVSEGNPLFVEELLRVGLSRAALPGALGAVIDEHLSRLSVRARLVLGAASVLGREFSFDALSAAFGFRSDEVAEDLSEAVLAGVLAPREASACAFSHALLRDRLYESLPPTRRAELHWKAGLAASREPNATAAHHLLEGCAAGDWEIVARAAGAAAGSALAQLAYEDVIGLSRRVRAVAPPGTPLGCELELLHAEALIRSGKADEGRALCRNVALLATELERPELLARAALVYATDFLVAMIDPTMVELLETALERLPTEPSALRARVMARLAVGLTPPSDEAGATRVIDLARASLVMARSVGDKEALLYCSDVAASGLGYLVAFEERAMLVSEAVDLASQLGQRLALERLGGLHIALLVEQGRRAEANVMLRALEEVMEQLPRTHRWRLLALQSVLAVLDGRRDDAIRLSDQSRELAPAGSPAEAVWGLQRIAIAQAFDDPAAFAPHADFVLRVGRGRRGTQLNAWTLAALGKPVEAAAVLEASLRSERGFPGMLWAGSACVLLQDPGLAARVYPELQAEFGRHRLFWGPSGGAVFGPTSRVLGELALLLGRREEASAYYDVAILHCRMMGAKPLLELALRGREACGTPVHAPAPEPRHGQVSLRREGELWALESGGTVVRLKHGKGVSYLEQLVLHTGRELHVLVLVGAEHVDGDAGSILDARAKAEYQSKIQLLDDRIEMARSLGDERGVAKARAELDALAEQLAAAVGLGGRDRRAASNVERARINVQRRLKDTIESISAVDAALGRYLQATVKTGTFCSFLPL